MMILKCQNYEITIRMAPELTADEAVGQSLRLCIIKHQVCIETSEYFMYDPKGTNPCGVFLIRRCCVLNNCSVHLLVIVITCHSHG